MTLQTEDLTENFDLSTMTTTKLTTTKLATLLAVRAEAAAVIHDMRVM